MTLRGFSLGPFATLDSQLLKINPPLPGRTYENSHVRAATLTLSHCPVQSPNLMNVGTYDTVKS
jgi:hypothetical protein